METAAVDLREGIESYDELTNRSVLGWICRISFSRETYDVVNLVKIEGGD